jgi:hypothetical protein
LIPHKESTKFQVNRFNCVPQPVTINTDLKNSSTSSAFDPLFPSAPLLIDQVIVNKMGETYAISTPIYNKESVIGTVAISYSKKALTDIDQQFGLISSLLILSGLLGWLIIYLLYGS